VVAMSLIRLGHVWRNTWYDLALYPAEAESMIVPVDLIKISDTTVMLDV
jgi:hypothetical protein